MPEMRVDAITEAQTKALSYELMRYGVQGNPKDLERLTKDVASIAIHRFRLSSLRSALEVLRDHNVITARAMDEAIEHNS